MKILIDANIAIDFMAQRKEYAELAETVFTLCYDGIIEGCFSASAVTSLYYVLNRYIKEREEIEKLMNAWFQFTGILDARQEDFSNAFLSSVTDYEYAVIEQIALRNGIDFIISRDRHFENSRIKTLTPAEFLSMLLGNPDKIQDLLIRR